MFSYTLGLKALGTFFFNILLVSLLSRVSKLFNQTTVLIYMRGNFVYHHWSCTLIYWPSSYPCRSLEGQKGWNSSIVFFFAAEIPHSPINRPTVINYRQYMYIFESTKNISRLFYWLLKNHVYPKIVQTEVQKY